MGGRALEQQVLQQVGHAGLAVVLVHRADQVGQVDGDRGLAGVGEQQHAQAVAHAVFADAFHAGTRCDALGRRDAIGEGGGGQGEQAGEGEAVQTRMFHGFRSGAGQWREF
jgi:hypothetical protein